MEQLRLGVGPVLALSAEEVDAQVRALVAGLEEARRAANLTHRQLAARACLPPSTVRSALAEDANPQLTTLSAIATALGFRLIVADAA